MIIRDIAIKPISGLDRLRGGTNVWVDILDIKDETGKSIFVVEEIDEDGNITYEASEFVLILVMPNILQK